MGTTTAGSRRSRGIGRGPQGRRVRRRAAVLLVAAGVSCACLLVPGQGASAAGEASGGRSPRASMAPGERFYRHVSAEVITDRTPRSPAGDPLLGDPRAPLGSPFPAAGVWRADVSGAPLDPRSPAMVRHLVRQVEDHWGGVAAFNVWNYNPSFYTVPAGQRRIDVRWDDCQGKGSVPGGLFGPGGQFVSVPVPSNAIPAAGSDGALTIYQPATDTMWDFWQAQKRGDGWHACWGGRLDHVSRSPGYFEGGFGASASGLPFAAGQVGIREAQAGEIKHALALQIIAPATWSLVSWPAQRSDGWDGDPDAIPEGTHLRLDPTMDVDALPLHPLARMVAKAAQKYGFIVTDKSGAVAVIAESGAPYEAWRGVNPWTALLRGTPMYDVMRNFPWQSLQILPKDHGRPAG